MLINYRAAEAISSNGAWSACLYILVPLAIHHLIGGCLVIILTQGSIHTLELVQLCKAKVKRHVNDCFLDWLRAFVELRVKLFASLKACVRLWL
jgi:hypothetical protein